MPGEATTRYICLLAVAATALFGGWIYSHGIVFGETYVICAAVLALVCALLRKFPVQFGKNSVSMVDVAVLTAMIVCGPVWAVIVALPGVFYRDRLRTLFMGAMDVCSILAAGYAFHVFSSPLLTDSSFGSNFVYGTLAAGTAFYAVNVTANTALMWLKYGTPPAETVRRSFSPLIPSDVLAVLAALGTAYATVSFGPAAALVLFSGAAAAVTSLHLIRTRQEENEALKEENANLLASVVEFAAGLVEAVGEKDDYTSRLAAASSVYVEDIGREFGFERSKADRLKVAALLQDVGFSGVPDEVLLAPTGRLNPAGRRQLERHPVVGEKILSRAAAFGEAAKWVRWHHERPDGSGYPDGLKGHWIPLEARILAAAETYSSLVLDGPGSPALPAHEARLALTALSGKGLDGEVVKTLLRVLDRESADYATAAGERFAFSRQVRESRGRVSLRVVGSEAAGDR